MAHADYACCAVCDVKMYYSCDVGSKEEICSRCVLGLLKATGKEIMHVPELIVWFLDAEDPGVVLFDLGYRPCFYANEFDGVVRYSK